MSIDAIADAAAGPFAAACALLVMAGASKLRRPVGTRPAAAALGLPATPAAVRTLGVVELMVAAAGLSFGGWAAVAVAIVYAALAIAAWRLFVQAPGTACGCLGASDAPVSRAHIVVNIAAALAAVLAIAAGPPLSAVGDGVWARFAFVALVACCASLVAAVLDARPVRTRAATEGGSG